MPTNYATNGNISSKKDVSGQMVTISAYDPAHPHAAKTVGFNSQTITIGYDANGNMLSRSSAAESWNLKWAGAAGSGWNWARLIREIERVILDRGG